MESICRNARACCALLLLCIPASLSATTILGMDIDEVATGAELVFEGQVLEHSVQENAAGMTVTYVTFRVSDVLKGDYPDTLLELKFTGGVLGGQVMEVSGLRIPKLDEQGIYFVESTSRDLINPLLGWSQGHFLIIDDEDERRMSTINLEPVTDVQSYEQVPSSLRRPRSYVDGDSSPANGIITDAGPFQFDQALTVDEFKSRIREMIEP